MTPLATLVSGASVVLLDFDGPVSRLFAGRSIDHITEAPRLIITDHGESVPDSRPDDDWTRSRPPSTVGATDVLDAARASGRRVAVFSNKPAKRHAMVDAQADAVIAAMPELAEALHAAPRLSC